MFETLTVKKLFSYKKNQTESIDLTSFSIEIKLHFNFFAFFSLLYFLFNGRRIKYQ